MHKELTVTVHNFYQFEKLEWNKLSGAEIKLKICTGPAKEITKPKRLGPYIQDLGQSFSRYGPPAREITSMYCMIHDQETSLTGFYQMTVLLKE